MICRKKGYIAKSIVLFVSVARGKARIDSDVDLLVIASNLPVIEDRQCFRLRKPSRIDNMWMMPEDLRDIVDAKTGFVVSALLEGRVLKNKIKEA